MKNMLKKAVYLVFFSIIAYAALKTTTFGWHAWSGSYKGGGSPEITRDLKRIQVSAKVPIHNIWKIS